MKRSLGNNLIWNSVGITFYFGCQWLLTVVVVYFRGGYSDAGVLSLAVSIANVLSVIACLNLRVFQISELDGKFSDGDFLVNRALMSAVSVILCICVVAYCGYRKYEAICIVVFMIFKVSETLTDVLHGIAQKAWRLDIAGKSFILRGLAILASIGCGMLLNGNLLLTICIMTVLTYFIIYIYDYCQCRKQLLSKFFYRWSNIWSLVKVGIPLALYFIFLNLISTFPRFQIEKQYGKELLGIFSSIATPTVLVTQLASFVFSPLMGVFAECRKDGDKRKIYKLLLISVGVTMVIGIAAVTVGKVLGEWALVLLFGESIREYAYLLIPIIYTAILTALIWLLCGLLTVFKDYYMLAALTLVSLFICLVSAPYLIAEKQLIGAVGALLAALLAETLFLLVRLVYLLSHEETKR